MKEMSFIGFMKDKTGSWDERNVLHRAYERQKEAPGRRKCPS
ncbi:hypothetical protein SB48_HM08orf01720 [Heyndrickxia coagulans]|uniref:Uncharacterized protein n=1 Tax=Heyndrickxia coagulans TaxID=1398 RepID=A0AAN0WAL5_HEYCO|nr:hypothetical protein SB48_HM08orf01720 [Heyndrickxia coagulans]